ncbi:hypothetical protein NPX13_g7866 [Xylaria arbuscula]|uniref:Uncharacterized protein n=1 Tax=Xylaria arbuscula TaxID=114810 RepID=A0A9W8TIV7_9PEZI|nr:hypothetical protein NPX13_g7866 [Xylaria arbuscula]
MEVPLRPDQLYTPPPMADLSMVGHRLLWTLQGPLSSSVFVLPEDHNSDGARELLLRQTPAGARWHLIAQEPITHIPVASLTDVQPDLDDLPPKFDLLVVRALSRDFVTVQDVVSAVHPWLMERRGDILRAINVADEEYTPPASARLLVLATRPEELSVEDEDEWMSALRRIYERTIAPAAGDIYNLIRSLR